MPTDKPPELAGDLTRADAQRAIEEVRRALGALNHLAIAGMLHVDEGDLGNMSRLVAAHGVAQGFADVLGESALRLPERWPEPNRDRRP